MSRTRARGYFGRKERREGELHVMYCVPVDVDTACVSVIVDAYLRVAVHSLHVTRLASETFGHVDLFGFTMYTLITRGSCLKTQDWT